MLGHWMMVVGMILLIGSMFMPEKAATPKQAEPVKVGEVSDLIERLRPLAKEPDRRWGGIEITFTGAEVSIKLTTKDDNEYNGRAKTLKEAVSRITDPSSTIREALRGWDQPTGN